MEHILRTVEFSVDAQSVTPEQAQFGGVAGDDGTTRVVLTLDAALRPAGARYRILCTDGLGDTHTSDFIPLDEGGALLFTLPAAWTAAGGLCACQAVIEGFDDNGQVQSAFYTPPCRLYLIGCEGEAPVRRAVGSLLADCHRAVAAAAQSADSAAQDAQDAALDADKAKTFAEDAATAALAAGEDALAARQDALAAEQAAAEMGDIAAILPLLGGALMGHKAGNTLSFGDLSALPHAVQLTASPANLIPFPYAEQSKTVNGITFTVNQDGSIAVQGTASADAELVLADEGANLHTEEDFCLYGAAGGAALVLTYLADSGAETVLTDDGAGVWHPRARRIARVCLRVQAGETVDAVARPMLVRGQVQSAFAPRTVPQQVTLTVAGKNLMDYLSLYGNHAQQYGLTVQDGVVSGISTNCAVPKQVVQDAWIGQTVTFSARLRCNGPAATAKAAVAVYNPDGSTRIGEMAAAGNEDMVRCCLTRTVRRGDMFMISNAGADSANQTVWITDMQLELGDTATDYVPYTEWSSIALPLKAGALRQGDTVWAAQKGVRLDARYQRDIAAAIREATQ